MLHQNHFAYPNQHVLTFHNKILICRVTYWALVELLWVFCAHKFNLHKETLSNKKSTAEWPYWGILERTGCRECTTSWTAWINSSSCGSRCRIAAQKNPQFHKHALWLQYKWMSADMTCASNGKDLIRWWIKSISMSSWPYSVNIPSLQPHNQTAEVLSSYINPKPGA
jgi:hypothetical protein